MDRFSFLKALREKCGYSGSNKDADILAFYEENKDSIVLPKGVKSVNDILTKKVSISISADAGEEIEVQQDEPVSEEDKGEEPMLSGSSANPAKAFKTESGKKAFAKSGEANKSAFGAPAIHDNSSTKAYKGRIANGKSYFKTPESAEYMGAQGRLLCAEMSGIKSYSQKDNDLAIVGKTGTTVNNLTGGNLVFSQVIPELIWRSEEYGVARKVFRTVELQSESADQPILTGLSTWAPLGQASSASATDPNFSRVSIFSKTFASFVVASRQLMDDAAIDLGDVYAKQFVEGALAWEDQCCILGDGTDTYGNIGGLQGRVQSAARFAGTGTAWSSYVLSDFSKLEGNVANVKKANCCYIMSRQFFYQVPLRLANAAQGNGSAQILKGADGISDSQAILNGFPVYFSAVMPTSYAASSASGAQSCWFGDFQGAGVFGYRNGLQVDTSGERYFDQYAMAFRAINRFGFTFHNDGNRSTVGMVTSLYQS